MECPGQVINGILLINKDENQQILFSRIVKFPLLRSHREGWDRDTMVCYFSQILFLAAASTFSSVAETHQVRGKSTW